MSDQAPTDASDRSRTERKRCLVEIERLYDFLIEAADENGCRIQVVTDDHGGTGMVKLSAQRCREVLEGVRLAASAVILMSDTEQPE